MVRMNKYRAIKVKNEFGTFDSKGEHLRYTTLDLLQKAGEIADLRRQVKIILVAGRDGAPEIPRGDRLDAMLRAWHDENAAAAREKRDEIVRALAREQSRRRARPVLIDVVARIGFARLAAAAMFLVASALVTPSSARTLHDAFRTRCKRHP